MMKELEVKFLKLLNPFIWLWNIFKYFAHMERFRGCEKRGHEYEPYDFEKNETKYF